LLTSYNSRAVGIFDSGIGGLTVMKAIIEELPDENIIYLGDTARVPYGTRSSETVKRYSFENTEFLISRDIKVLVVACNTSSAVSLEILRQRFPIPIIGVVEPGAKAAIRETKTKKIGVIGTEATIKSNSYVKAIHSIDSSVQVIGKACPLFVPLVEEGWHDGDVVYLVAEKYLSDFKNSGVDVLILGCTHYPVLKDVIQDIVPVTLIDSAIETARELKRVLKENNLLNNSNSNPRREFFVTDYPEKFVEVGERFLGQPIENIVKIAIHS